MRCFKDVWSLSLALSFLAVATVQAVTAPVAIARDAPAFGSLSQSPWGLDARTTRVLEDLRGGGIFGGTKKSAARIYKESLEEQVVLLNEQLMHARTEIATLRENAKKRKSNSRVKPVPLSKEEEKANTKLEKQRAKEQKEALARLEKEVKQLEQMKGELEKMLETSAKKIELLEEQLASQEDLTAKLEASYKDKIAKLEEQLEKVQTAQLEKLTEIHQQKIDAAVQEALRVQEAEFRAKMEETTKRLSKEHAKEMEQEKLRSSKAVETERKKMRKLVRALALREKKLKLQTPVGKEESAKKTSVKTKTSSPKNPFVPPTSRGTI